MSTEYDETYDRYTVALYEMARDGDDEAFLYIGASLHERNLRDRLLQSAIKGEPSLVDRLRARVVAKILE